LAAQGHSISESKDLTSRTIVSLFGKLREHELEMNKLNVQESEDKHVRNINLKAAGHKNCQDSSDDSEGETLSLLTRKFSKFLKKTNNKNQSSNMYNSKKLMILILTNIPALDVVNRDILKLIAPIKRAQRKRVTRSMRRKANQEEHTMIIHPQAHHQRKMKKPIFVLWKRMNSNQAV